MTQIYADFEQLFFVNDTINEPMKLQKREQRRNTGILFKKLLQKKSAHICVICGRNTGGLFK
jgi:hypothetical protein